MKNRFPPPAALLFALIALGTVLPTSPLLAATAQADSGLDRAPKSRRAALPAGIERREVVIFSDGVRMAGDLYLTERKLDFAGVGPEGGSGEGRRQNQGSPSSPPKRKNAPFERVTSRRAEYRDAPGGKGLDR